MTEPDLLAETVVPASVARVWAAVGDPARMSRWSEEVLLVRPLGRVGTGARTLNLNRRGVVVWPTSSVIERYEPQREIAWRVAASGTVWSLQLAPGPISDTTLLVHRRRVPGPRPWVARVFAPVIGGVAQHDRELAAAMHRTLAAIVADVGR